MKKIRVFWEANFLLVEAVLAVMFALVFYVWSVLINRELFITAILFDGRNELYGALTALFGSMLGFIITATSIVLGYADSDKLEIVRKSKHYLIYGMCLDRQ